MLKLKDLDGHTIEVDDPADFTDSGLVRIEIAGTDQGEVQMVDLNLDQVKQLAKYLIDSIVVINNLKQ